MTSLRQLRYFVTVARCGSFTAAAQRLHVSQPALGLQIKQIEDALGVKLLSRHARGIALTEAGTSFLSHATEALEAIERAERSAKSFKPLVQEEISLGVTPTPGQALAADLLHACAEKAPHIKIVLHEGLTDKLCKLITDGELAAALCYDPAPADTVEIIPLYQEDLFLVGPPTVVDPSRGPVDLESLGDFPLVLGHRLHRARRFIETVVHKSGINLASVLEVEPTTLKREILIRHDRCSIVPYGLFWDSIKAGQLSAQPIRPAISRQAVLVLNTAISPTVRRFLLSTVQSLVSRRIEEGELGWRAVPEAMPATS